jgi:hypothetical protein
MTLLYKCFHSLGIILKGRKKKLREPRKDTFGCNLDERCGGMLFLKLARRKDFL